jgi:hypothetical protein
VGITELIERVGKRATWIVETRESGHGVGCALLSVGGCGSGETCAALDMFGRGWVRTRMRGDRIQTCRSKLDSDQINGKVGGTEW